MITSELRTSESRPFTFPVLAKCKTEEIVVLFDSPGKGMVVGTKTKNHPLGKYTEWQHVDNARLWEVLPKGSQVILTQE